MRPLLILLILFAAWPTTSAEAGPVVLHAPGMTPEEALQEAVRILDRSDLRAARPLAAELRVGPDDVVVVGATVQRCGGEVESRSLTAAMHPINRALDEMQYTTALATLRGLVDRLPCYGAGATREQLFDFFFRGGLAAYYAQQPELAKELFSRAAALDPARQWPAEYPPQAKPLYLQGLQKALATSPAGLFNDTGAEVWLDGAPTEGEARLFPGGHLLWPKFLSTGLWVTVGDARRLPDGKITVTNGARLLQGLLLGSPRYAPHLDAQGWEHVVLVSDGLVIEFKDGSFVVPEKMAAELERRRKAAQGPPPAVVAGAVLTGASLGVAGVGVALHMSAFQQGRVEVGKPLPTAEEYASIVGRNRAGLGLTVGGAVGAGVGVGLLVGGTIQRLIEGAPSAGVRPEVLPWLAAGPGVVTLGVGGTWR